MKIQKPPLAFIASCIMFAGSAFAQVNITTWQANNLHTGANLNETTLTPALVKSPGNFGLLFSDPMDGQCYTQPLYVSGLTVNGGAHNVVYLETEHCTVYAFDGDNQGAPLWSKSLLPAGSDPVPQSDVNSSDINVELGNTATPVIDLSTQTIYCLSKTKNRTDGSYQQQLHALDLTTGVEKFGGPIVITAAFAGKGNNQAGEGLNGVINFNPLREHERCALTLSGGVVYLMYASHSDTQPYHGEILGYTAGPNLTQVKKFISTPNDELAGFWQGGASAAIDGAGNMFVATGNGNYDQNANSFTTDTDWGQSVLKLSTTGTFDVSTSNPLNFFTPYNWGNPGLNFGDQDLGSSGFTLLPDQAGPHTHIMVGGGKSGTLYVIDRDNMGGNTTVASAHNNTVQELTEPKSLFVTPAYYNGFIYYAPAGGNLTQRAVGYRAGDTTNPYIDPVGFKSNFTYNGGHGAGAFISANGATNGLVWVIDQGKPAHLHAYDATNVSGDPLVSVTATLPGNINVEGPKFSLPTVANGKVYFSGFDYDPLAPRNNGYFMAFGKPAPQVGVPTSPGNPVATAVSSNQINLSWQDTSNNENGFEVLRSTSPTGPFLPLSPDLAVGANVTSTSDTKLTPSTTYYYQIVATSGNGNSPLSVVASATTFPPYVEKGLVAYWNLDETVDGPVTDDTGNGHLGTPFGEQNIANGLINNGHEFHGAGAIDSHIAVANAADLQFTATQSFTISAWVNQEGVRAAAEAILAKSRDQGNYYGIWIDVNNHWVFRGPGGDIVGPLVALDTWTHVTAVQDGAAGTRQLYINGVLAASGAAQAGDGPGDFWMGQAHDIESGADHNIEPFPGLIDEVRVYNRALSATEVHNLLAPPVTQEQWSVTQGGNSYPLVLGPLPVPGVEPRTGAPQGSYKLTLNFSAPVSGVTATLGLQGGGAAVGTVGTISIDPSGLSVTIPLTNVGNVQKLDLHLANIQFGPISGGTADVAFNVLWGDVNQDGGVTSIDQRIEAIKTNPVQNTGVSNFIYDVNCDGLINSADLALVNANMGSNLGTLSQTDLALFAPPWSSGPAGSANPDLSPPSLAVDGNLGTRWETAHGIDPSWMYVDLGSVCTINKVVLTWENAGGKNYTIDWSNDAVNWNPTAPPIATVTGNTVTGVNNPLSYIAAAGTTARYVRMNGTARTTNFGYSLYNFQVFGVQGTTGGGPTPAITSPLTATGTVGTAFSYTITASNTPTSFTATNLPPGLTYNGTTGVISGTPTTAGSTNATISATNSNGPGTPATLVFTISAAGPTPAITSPLTATGTVGTAFSYTITASNTPLSFTATNLPPGLTYNAATGVISGTPTTAGSTSATISATNSNGPGTPATLAFTINAAGPTSAITSPLTATGTVGTAFSYTITASNTPLSFTATNLPPGLTYNATTGVISGTPTTAGSTSATISATNSNGPGTPATLVFTINAAGGGDVNLALGKIAVGSQENVGTPPVDAVDGNLGTRWSSNFSDPTTADTQSLVVNLGQVDTIHSVVVYWEAAYGKNYTIDVSNDGVTWNSTPVIATVTGNTTNGVANPLTYVAPAGTTGQYVRMQGVLRGSPYGYSIWEFQVMGVVGTSGGGATPAITSSLTATGTVGTLFSYTITASNTPTSFTATNLPPGLTYNGTTGVISGTPTTAGSTNATISATNSNGPGTPATLAFTISAAGPTPAITSPLTATGTVGTSFSYTITASNTPTSFTATNLPPGLTYNGTTGVISGTPTTAGTTNATISATNSNGPGTPVTLAFTINAGGDTNLSLTGTSSASSSQAGNGFANGNDGVATTRWAAADGTYPQYWIVDLGASKTLSRIDTPWYSSATRAYKYKVETSADGVTYDSPPKVDKTTNTTFGDTSDAFTATTRYVKITVTGATAGFASAYEFKVYGH